MSKMGKSSKVIRSSETGSSATGQYLQVDKGRPSKSTAGSALTMQTSKASSKTGQILKSVSSAHSEALTRLKNR